MFGMSNRTPAANKAILTPASRRTSHPTTTTVKAIATTEGSLIQNGLIDTDDQIFITT
jgi:hypothetical protein